MPTENTHTTELKNKHKHQKPNTQDKRRQKWELLSCSELRSSSGLFDPHAFCMGKVLRTLFNTFLHAFCEIKMGERCTGAPDTLSGRVSPDTVLLRFVLYHLYGRGAPDTFPMRFDGEGLSGHFPHMRFVWRLSGLFHAFCMGRVSPDTFPMRFVRGGGLSGHFPPAFCMGRVSPDTFPIIYSKSVV